MPILVVLCADLCEERVFLINLGVLPPDQPQSDQDREQRTTDRDGLAFGKRALSGIDQLSRIGTTQGFGYRLRTLVA